MKLYTTPEHPLRVYLEDEEPLEISRLLIHLDGKYAPPENDYANNSEDEISSLVFYDVECDKHYIVRGLLNIITREADLKGIPCNNEVPVDEQDRVYPEIDVDMLEGISLRPYQSEGISSALANERGIIQVHTGGGKTEMMIGVTKYLLDSTDINILLCVPTTNLLYQTYDRMISRGIPESEVSMLGDGNIIDSRKRILISTVQSAYKRLNHSDEYMEWLSNTECLMMDEAHHSKCRTWSTLIDQIAPRYLLGFSAEPFHRDKEHIISDLILRGLLGPVIHRVTSDYLVSHGYLSRPYILAVDSRFEGNMYRVIDWATVNKNCIVNNKLRNQMISDISVLLINENKKPLILVQQIAHGHTLAKAISKLGYNVYMMTGGMTITVFLDGKVIDKYTDSNNQVVRDFNEGKIDALIGTSTLDEGVDIPALSAVILAGGGKSRLKNIQRIGRGLRPKSGDNTTVIIDFRDRFNIVTNSHFLKRKSSYDDLNMPVYYVSDLRAIKDSVREFSSLSKEG